MSGKTTIRFSEPTGDNAERFGEITEAMRLTYACKNANYGDSYSHTVRELGPVAGLVPILHKCNRLKTLLKGNEAKVKDESMRDTLLDMANYCILLMMELDRE